MQYEIQCGKITTSERLSDRFLNCQSILSSDLEKSFMGKIFTLTEIMSPWLPTAQVGQSIIATFTKSYYNGESTSDLENFEDALKKVNDNLALVTQNGETDWIGNLNAVLAVVVENKIHMTQTGTAEVYIFRDGKTNHVTAGLTETETDPHPLKTFSNITSGELKEHDKVLISNPTLFKHISLESLRQIISLGTAKEAILQIAKLLKKKKIKSVNLLIIEAISSEEASRQTPNDLADTIHLDKPLESFSIWLERTWTQILSPICKFIIKNIAESSKITWIVLKKYTIIIKNKIDTSLKNRAKTQASKIIKNIEYKDKFEKEFFNKNDDKNSLLKDEEIKYSPELSVHIYEQKQLKEQKFMFKVQKMIEIFMVKVQPFFKKFVGFFRNIFKKPKNKSYFYILIAIILLICLIFFIYNKTHSQKPQVNLLDAQNILREAESLQKNAQSALLSNQSEKGKQLLAESIVKAKQITSNGIVKQNAEDLIKKSFIDLDKLTQTTRFEKLNPVTVLNQNIKNIYNFGNQVYILDKDKIYRNVADSTKPEEFLTLPKNYGDFQIGTINENIIYLYTSMQKVFAVNINDKNINLVKNDGTWETANSLSYYNNNLYLLDGIIGQIYKHTFNAENFSGGQIYIESPSIDIKNSQSITIDGSIYILRNSGEVLKLQKGKLQDFSLTGIPNPWSKIEKPLKIYTDTDSTSLYILDSGQKRILEFDKDGKFIHQYSLPDTFNEINDFAVSSKSKKIWISNRNELFEISI